MRTSFFLAAWSMLALLLPAERSAGQDGPPTDKPYVFFSAIPDEATDAAPGTPLRQLNLRPNQEQPYYVYVYNPTAQKKSVLVQLVSTRKTGQIAVAAEQTVEVGSKQAVRVQLLGNKAQIPPNPPTSLPTADGKVAAAPLPIIPLYSKPQFRAVVADTEDEKGTKIGLVAKDLYTTVEKPTFTDNKLKIVVKRKVTEMVGGPIAVRLIPRNKNGDAIDPAKLAAEGNSLEGFLATSKTGDGAQEVELVLNTKDLAEYLKDGYAEVTIDGAPRALWCKLNGEPADPVAPFGVAVPLVAIPGKPITVRFIGDGAPTPPEGSDYRVVFNRTGSTAGEQIKNVPSKRNEGIDVRIGANSEAIFVTRSEDWVVEFPTQGVFGKRDFFARASTTDSPKREVKFDATAPTIALDAEPAIKPLDPKAPILKMYRPGQRIKVTATGKDAESDIDSSKGAIIYLGEKPGPDGKPSPNGQVKPGRRIGTTDSYEAEFDLPPTLVVSDVKIGAIFVNGVGLAGSGEAEIKVDYTPPEITVLRFNPAKEPLAAYKPGDTVRLYASAFDEESGIDLSRPVQFFIGDPPGLDGKPVQTTLVWKDAEGVISDLKTSKGHPYWAADLTLPKDIKKETELKVGVWFVNGVGLAGSRVATIKLDKDFTTATLKVKVVQGSDRLQPGVKVWLLDQFGKVADEGKTDDCGVVTFVKVLPGTYTVWAVKDADQNAHDFKTVVARGGDETDVSLSIKRQPAPPTVVPQQPQR